MTEELDYAKLDENTARCIAEHLDSMQQTLREEYEEYKKYKYAKKKVILAKEEKCLEAINFVLVAKMWQRDIIRAKDKLSKT